jgi:hypothetical protein
LGSVTRTQRSAPVAASVAAAVSSAAIRLDPLGASALVVVLLGA